MIAAIYADALLRRQLEGLGEVNKRQRKKAKKKEAAKLRRASAKILREDFGVEVTSTPAGQGKHRIEIRPLRS